MGKKRIDISVMYTYTYTLIHVHTYTYSSYYYLPTNQPSNPVLHTYTHTM